MRQHTFDSITFASNQSHQPHQVSLPDIPYHVGQDMDMHSTSPCVQSIVQAGKLPMLHALSRLKVHEQSAFNADQAMATHHLTSFAAWKSLHAAC